MIRSIRKLAAYLGIGLISGLAGTAVMTAVQTVEMKLTGREPSTVPADAVSEVIDVEPRTDRAEMRLANLAHWGYGTVLGAGRGVLAAAGLPPIAADPLFFAGVWGAGLAMLPAMGLAEPVTEWSPQEVAMDAAHHLVYAIAVATAFRQISRQSWWERSLI